MTLSEELTALTPEQRLERFKHTVSTAEPKELWATLLSMTTYEGRDAELLKEALETISAYWRESAKTSTPIFQTLGNGPEAFVELEKWFLIGVAWSQWIKDQTQGFDQKDVLDKYLAEDLPPGADTRIIESIKRLKGEN